MNTKSLFVVGFMVLLTVFARVFTVFAFPAENPAETPFWPGQANACQVSSAAVTQVEIDIPAHRADYEMLDRLVPCIPAGLSADASTLTIASFQINRYTLFKDLQADLASGDAFNFIPFKAIPFAEFKELQAELRSQ